LIPPQASLLPGAFFFVAPRVSWGLLLVPAVCPKLLTPAWGFSGANASKVREYSGLNQARIGRASQGRGERTGIAHTGSHQAVNGARHFSFPASLPLFQKKDARLLVLTAPGQSQL
jgi:hypothetical protein